MRLNIILTLIEELFIRKTKPDDEHVFNFYLSSSYRFRARIVMILKIENLFLKPGQARRVEKW